MNKNELIASFGQIVNGENLTVDLHFIFKEGDGFKAYLTQPSEELRKEIKDELVKRLKWYLDNEDDFVIEDIYSSNAFDERTIHYDKLENNSVAIGLFNYETAELNQYTKEVGSFSQIFGFVIEVDTGDKKIKIFKKNAPVHAFGSAGSWIRFMSGEDDHLKLLTDEEVLRIEVDFSVVQDGEDLIIRSRKVYEKNFGFRSEIESRAKKAFIELKDLNVFEISDDMEEKIPKLTKTTLKKFGQVLNNNPIINGANWDGVVQHAKDYKGYEFKKAESGKIRLKSIKDFDMMIKVLNREFNKNELTDERFETPTRVPIKAD